MKRKQRKSKFQQRLEEVQKHHEKYKEETSSGAATAGKVRLHKEETTSEDPEDPQSQIAQEVPGDWISIEDEIPPYYSPIDIFDGMDIMNDWNRVSDGDHDYYVNQATPSVCERITHWRKRPGVNYIPYDPMTAWDIPILTTNEVQEIVATLERTKARRTRSMFPHIEYNGAIDDCITIIETTLKLKTRTKRITENTIPRNTGG